MWFKGEVVLQDLVRQQWQSLTIRFPEIETDEFVVMPNHIHGIILIVHDINDSTIQGRVGATHESPADVQPPRATRELPLRPRPLKATRELPLHRPTQLGEEYRKYRQRMLIPKIVGYFKMNTAKRINQILNRGGHPFWQRNYYEHVIRNEEEMSRIREYIRNNPLKWELDRENPESVNFHIEQDEYWREVYGG
jgi:REP element-mobilizing transposase RayT